MEIRIQDRLVGHNHPVYFIADIAANHDGDLGRAKELIHIAAQRGADAAKFQNFRAPHIVSKKGFEALESQLSHQKSWKKSVYEVYEDATVSWDWTPELKMECDKAGIHYFSAPYDLEAVDMLESYVPAYKVGSGDIDWLEELEAMAKKGKPMILSTGAATLEDVDRAIECVKKINPQIILLQCNTNYTGSEENFSSVNLRVIQTYAQRYPDLVLGLSDHTPGYTAVLGAVALGARVIEKHFTDDRTREGPDHPFSLDPDTWGAMVKETRLLESALGDGIKKIEENEKDTQFIQRRCVRAARRIPAGKVIERSDITVLRPAVEGGVKPDEINKVVGGVVNVDVEEGDVVSHSSLVTGHKSPQKL